MRRLFISLLFAIALLAQGGVQSVDIPVSKSAWQFGAGSRLDVAPDGSTVIVAAYGSRFIQDLGVSPASFQEYKPGYTITGFYTLTFSVMNSFPSYPGYYTAEISFGTQELCETSGWATNVTTQIQLICPSPGYLVIDQALPSGANAEGAKNFLLSVSVSGWPVLFPVDKIGMHFIPQ